MGCGASIDKKFHATDPIKSDLQLTAVLSLD